MIGDINNDHQGFQIFHSGLNENESYKRYFNNPLNESLNFTNSNDNIISCDKLDTESLTNFNKSNKINKFNTDLLKIINFNFPILKEKKLVKNNKNKKKENNQISKNNNSSKKLGRKTERATKDNNDENNGNIHGRSSDDNMRKKCKNIILKYLRYFINNKIKTIYKGNIGIGDFKKEIKIVEQGDKAKSTVGFDKEFLEKTLLDIFSQNVSKRFSNFSFDHNKKIIDELIQEEDLEKRNYFKNLFNLRFLDCLKYFIGTKHYKELEGFTKLTSIEKNELDKYGDVKYLNHLIYYFNNFESIIKEKPKNKKIKDISK